MYSLDGLFGDGIGAGGGGEINSARTLLMPGTVPHGPAIVTTPSTIIKPALPIIVHLRFFPLLKGQRPLDRAVLFLLIAVSFLKKGYCKLRRTRISPVPWANGSSALPINVPGRWIFTPPISTGIDFIATPSLSLVTSKSPI